MPLLHQGVGQSASPGPLQTLHSFRPLRKSLARLSCATAIWAALMAGTGGAATYYWDADLTAGSDSQLGQGLGGTGTWDSSTLNWWNGTNADLAWPNTAVPGDAAIFSGASGTVTLGQAINVNALTFGVSNYLVTGQRLNLVAAAPALFVTSFGDFATVNSDVLLGANVVLGGAGNLTLGGVMSGLGFGFNKTGIGTLTLSGANDFTGTATLTAGTLVATGNAAALGTGVLSLGGGTLQLANDSSLTYGNATTVNSNLITRIVSDTAGATTGVTHTLGALTTGGFLQTLQIDGGRHVTSGTQGLTFGGVTLTDEAAFTVTNPTTAGTARTLLTLGAMSMGIHTATFNGTGDVVQTGAWGSGTGGITHSGSGTLTLSQANTFTGAVTAIYGGTVVATGSASALGANTGAGGITLSSNGTLRLAYAPGASVDLSAGGTLANTTVADNGRLVADVAATGQGASYTLGNLTLGNSGRFTIDGGDSVSGGTVGVTFGSTVWNGLNDLITVNNPAAGGTSLLSLGSATNAGGSVYVVFNGSGNIVQRAAWSVGAFGTFSYSGSGTLLLNQANTFPVVTVAGGTVVARTNAAALGSGTLTLAGGNLLLTQVPGQTLSFGRNTTVSGSVTITGDVIGTGAANTYAFGTLAMGSQQLTIARTANVTSGASTVSFIAASLTSSGNFFNVGAGSVLSIGSLTGSTNIFKDGPGTLTLSAAAASRGGSGTNEYLTYVRGGTLVLGGVGNGATVDSLTSSAAAATSTFLALGANSVLDLATGTNIPSSVAPHPVFVLGNATVLSNAAASSSGFTQKLGALTSLGPNTVNIGIGANVTGTLGTVAFGAARTTGATTFSINPSTTLTLASTLDNGGYTTTFSGAGNASVTSTLSGGGGLVMNGAGTLTLSASNSYTGGTTINSGSVTLGNGAGLGTGGLTMNGGTLKLAVTATTLLSLSGSATSAIPNALTTLTVTPVPNSESSFAGVIGGGTAVNLTVTAGVATRSGGAFTLGGANTYTGPTNLLSAKLNLNNSGTSSTSSAIGTGTLTVNNGILDNTSGHDVALGTNNASTISGRLGFGGSGNLDLGAGTMTVSNTAGQFFSLAGTTGRTLRIGKLVETPNALQTVLTVPGANSRLAIGTFDPGAYTGVPEGLAGNSEIAIVNGIQPASSGANFYYGNSGTLTLTGSSTYTGPTVVSGGTINLDATGGVATLSSSTTLVFEGGRFTFKGNATGAGQTVIGTSVNGVVSTLEVVAGVAGTTLALGDISTANRGVLNLKLTGAGAAVTTTTANGNDNLFGDRGAFTVTTGNTTEFATRNASNQLVQYTAQTPFVGSGAVAGTNYKLSGSGQVTVAETLNSLRLSTVGAAAALDLNGQALSLSSGGLLFTGADPYEIKDVATGGSLVSAGADLCLHNYGTGGLTISAVIPSVVAGVTLAGSGTTTLTGANAYTGNTVVGYGSTLRIDAYAALGNSAKLVLAGGTLQVGATTGLIQSGSTRDVALGADGGTFDVMGASKLTVSGVIGNVSTNSAGSLTKLNTGTLILTGANTYTGGFTYIQNGAVVLGTSFGAVVGSLPSSTIVVLGSAADNTSGVLQIGDSNNTASQTIGGLATLGSGTANAIVGGNATFSTLTYSGSPAMPMTFDGRLGGAGPNQNNLTLNLSAGALTLNGANTYAGGTTFPFTTALLNLGHPSALGTGSLSIDSSTAALDNTSGAPLTLSNNNNLFTSTGFIFAGSNSLSFGSGALSVSAALTGTSVYGRSTLSFGSLVNNISTGNALTLMVNGAGGTLSLGGFNMQKNAGSVITNTITGSANVTFTGPITPGSFNPANRLTYTGTGTLTLAGADTYTGVTTLNNAGGKLAFAPGASLNGGAGALTLTAGTVDLSGVNLAVGTFTPTAGSVTNSGAAATLTASGLVSGAAHFSGNLSLALSNPFATAATLDGAFTNTGNVRLTSAGGSITTTGLILNAGNLDLVANSGNVTLAGALVNPTGVINLSGAGGVVGTSAGITATIGSNVSAINVTGGSFSFNYINTLQVHSTGTIITQSGASRFTGPGSVLGTGNLTLVNNSPNGGLIVFNAGTTAFTGDLILQANNSSGGEIRGTLSLSHAGAIINSGTGNAVVTLSGDIGGAVTAVIQKSSTSPLVLTSAQNTWSGDLIIRAGTVSGPGQVNADPSGFGLATNLITLGDSTGSANVALYNTSTSDVPQAILVPRGNTGTATLGSSTAYSSAGTFTGPITLDHHDLILTTGAGDLVLSGIMKGQGNLTFATTGSGGITLTHPGLDFYGSKTPTDIVGTITNASSGSGTITIDSQIGPSVRGVTQNSATSMLVLSSPYSSWSTGLNIKAGTVNATGSLGASDNPIILGDSSGSASITLTGSSGAVFTQPITVAFGNTGVATLSGANFAGPIVLNSHSLQLVGSGSLAASVTSSITSTGTGNDLTIKNNVNPGFTLGSEAINPAGSITNSGTGSGSVTITGAIGNKVMAITQDSINSVLSLSGANAAFTGNLTVIRGLLSANAGGLGTGGTAFLGTAATPLSGASLGSGATATFSNPIVVTGNANGGSLSVMASAGAPVFSGPIAANSSFTLQCNAGASLTVSGGISTATGAANLTLNAAGPMTISGRALNNAGSITTTGTAAGAITIRADIGGQVTSLTQNFAGSLTLSGANLAFHGATTVTSGTLSITGGSSTPFATTALTIASSATLNLVSSSSQTLNLGGTPLSMGTATLALSPGISIQPATPYGLTLGATTLTGNPTFNITANGGAPGTLTLGALSDGGTARAITYSSGGILRFGSAATSFKSTAVLAVPFSAVVLGATDALGAGAQIALGDLSGSAAATLRVDTAGVVTSNPIVVRAGSTGLATIESTQNGLATFAGPVTLSKDLTLAAAVDSITALTAGIDDGPGSFAVNKSGAGLVTLAGLNSYGGATTVTGGTLQVSGSLTATSDINVNAGALVLGASDSINNSTALNLAGGTFKTGGFSEGDAANAGLGLLRVNAGSVLDFGVGGSSQLMFAGLGNHVAGASLSIENWSSGSDQADPGQDRLMFVGDDAARIAFQSTFAPGDISFNGSFGFETRQIDVGHFEVVPEPSAGLLVVAALSFFGLRRTPRQPQRTGRS